MKLSGNFFLYEFTRSETAEQQGIDNSPDTEVIDKLRDLANLLQLIRNGVGGKKVSISSGFRCIILNKAVNGSKGSDHLTGRAADFRIDGMTVEDTFRWIIENIHPDRYRIVIHEYGRWIHLSIPDGVRKNGIKKRFYSKGKPTHDNKYNYIEV